MTMTTTNNEDKDERVVNLDVDLDVAKSWAMNLASSTNSYYHVPANTPITVTDPYATITTNPNFMYKYQLTGSVDDVDNTENSNVLNENETITKILRGVNVLCDTIKLTLGTKGMLVLYSSFRDFEDVEGFPVITKDGVTVASQISSDDPVINMAIQIVRQASKNTVRSSGDGTTSTAVLAQSIINQCVNSLNSSTYGNLTGKSRLSSWELCKQIDEAVELAINYIKLNSIAVNEDLEKVKIVASISSNSNEIGDLIHDVISQIGFNSEIEVKKSNFSSTEVELVKGMKLYKGYFAPFFCSDNIRMTWEQSRVKVLIYDDVIRDYLDIAPYVKVSVDDDDSTKALPLLIYAQDVAPTVLNRIENMMKHNPRPIMIVEHDGWGDRRIELLNDLSIMTNALIVDSNTVLNNPKKALGYCDECIVTSNTLSVLGGNCDEEARIQEIELVENKIKNGNLSPNESVFYKKRLSNLYGGVAVINVGGNTQVEMLEKYARIEDAVLAIKSSLTNGISIGGGFTWEKCADYLEKKAVLLNYTKESNPGYFIILNSLRSILDQLLLNSGNSYRVDEIRSKLNTKDDANNVKQKPQVLNLIDDQFYNYDKYKVYDATSVLTDSLFNAATVAKSIISIKRAVVPRKLQGVILE
jgi:chaperonin GroEL